MNMTLKLLSACITATLLLSGCANDFLKVTEGSERVLLMNAHQVTNCKSLGKISVTVLTKISFYTRDADTVDANLLQLGRNNAIALGGDTLVKDDRPDDGTQVFTVYKCKR